MKILDSEIQQKVIDLQPDYVIIKEGIIGEILAGGRYSEIEKVTTLLALVIEIADKLEKHMPKTGNTR